MSFYKIGLELAYSGGLALCERLAASGKKVFLDLKLHDIPTTVERAATQVAKLDATFRRCMRFPKPCRQPKPGSGLWVCSVLGVTVMTSYDDTDLDAAGYALGVRDLVAKRADQAVDIGIGGLILSAEEVEAMRRRIGTRLRLVTPGIRPPALPKAIRSGS